MRPGLKPVITICYRNRSLLLPAPGKVTPKLGVKRRMSEQKCTVYVKKTTKKKKKETLRLETGSGVGT